MWAGDDVKQNTYAQMRKWRVLFGNNESDDNETVSVRNAVIIMYETRSKSNKTIRRDDVGELRM